MTQMETKFMLCCPSCKTEREVDQDELNLILMCKQFMCWDHCGMDIWVQNLDDIFPSSGDD